MERSYWASVFFHGGMDLTAEVKKLEACKLTGISIPQVYGPPFVPLVAAAAVTKRLQLATGIAIGLVRSPFETAMAALDLDHLSKGRFTLGLGTGPMHWTNGYFGMPYDRPVSRLREVVQILRHVEDGARTGTMKPWTGSCYQLQFHGYEADLASLPRADPGVDCRAATSDV
jgi:alkanesulfonate monooxygenase SsuD/methylene tetrahydromethanopterin reductase-like flavin-dependent oxidoreductase (luciferase family)